jgi:uncharacterized membrane protein
MNDFVSVIASWGTAFLEVAGVGVIITVASYSVFMAAIDLMRQKNGQKVYEKYRHALARGILFGLELLVAADIIRTVTFQFDLESVTILAMIIFLRTFLSVTLNLEATGKWPWQQNQQKL